MKIRLLFLLSAVIITVTSAQLFSQDKSGQAVPSQEEITKRWQESMTPNDRHKKLEALAGSFTTESKFWMEGPDKPPSVSKGTAELTMDLEGRVLCQKISGEVFGMPMHGIGYTGYDNVEKKYWMFWIDNTSTAMYTAVGHFNEEGTMLTMTGTTHDFMTENGLKTVNYVCKLVDANTWVFEMQEKPEGGEFMTTGIITYTRKK